MKGVARFYKAKKKHVITTQTEHKCVLDSCRQLEAEGSPLRRSPSACAKAPWDSAETKHAVRAKGRTLRVP